MAKGPVKKFKLRRVEAAVWAKEEDDGYVRYSISVQKSYRDKETGEWQTTRNFFPEEAALASILIDEAVGWIAAANESGISLGEGEVNPEKPIVEKEDPKDAPF
jgi:hypothetical protein